MAIEEIFISTDIEADGRVPGISSMLSMGAAALTVDKKMHGWFTVNFELLENAKPDVEVMEFWAKNQAAYDTTRVTMVTPAQGTLMFVEWLQQIANDRFTPIFMGYPACFDYKWIDYYCYRFAGKNPFGHSRCFDVKSYAWAHLGGKFSHATKRNFPNIWKEKVKHTHIAKDDAIEQGGLAINMIRHVQGLPPITGFV